MKYFLALCLFILFKFHSTYASSFNNPYRPGYVYVSHYNHVSYKSHEGYVLLKNHADTIFGNIYLGNEDKKSITITLPRSSKPTIIQNDSIELIRLFATDTSVVTLPYTEYKVLGNRHRLWRLIGKGKSALYDNTVYCDEKPTYTGDYLFLVDKTTVIKSSYSFTWDTKADIIHFMNKHYQTKYKRKDFKYLTSAIQVLVNH